MQLDMPDDFIPMLVIGYSKSSEFNVAYQVRAGQVQNPTHFKNPFEFKATIDRDGDVLNLESSIKSK